MLWFTKSAYFCLFSYFLFLTRQHGPRSKSNWLKPDSCGSPGSLFSWYQEIPKKKSESSALLQSFRHFPYNDNPTTVLNTTSLKCCLLSTDTIERREKFTYASEGSRSPRASRFIRKFTRFSKKNLGYLFNRLIYGALLIRSYLIWAAHQPLHGSSWIFLH